MVILHRLYNTVLFFRCCWAVGKHDFIEAYSCQSALVQYPLEQVNFHGEFQELIQYHPLMPLITHLFNTDLDITDILWLSIFFTYSSNFTKELQLMVQFRIFPSSESRHSFVANYTSAVKFKIHILVLFCCIIIPLYVSESKYL